MNSHIKRPRITVNERIGSRKKPISQLHICKITDKKTAYNEGRLVSISSMFFARLFCMKAFFLPNYVLALNELLFEKRA